MDVRLPDGRVARNVPEGTTQTELLNNLDKYIEPKKPSEQKIEESVGILTGKKSWDENAMLGKLLNQIIPEPEKIPEQLKRQLGLTGRYLTEGTSETADFFATPVREGLNLFLPEENKIKPITESVVQPTLKELNIPEPKTKQERIVGQASKMIPLVGGPNILIKSLKPETQIGKNIQEALLESEGKQITSGALMGAGSQYAAEEGAGTGGQLGVGFGASILPFLTKGKNLKQTPLYKQELSKKQLDTSNELLNAYEYEVASVIKSGALPEDAANIALKNINVPKQKLDQAFINTNRAIPSFVDNKGLIKIDAVENAIKQFGAKEYTGQTLLSKLTVPISTEIKRMSEGIFNRLRRHDFNEHRTNARKINIIKPFIDTLDDLSSKNKKLYKQVTLDLYNGKHDNVLKVMESISPEARKSFINAKRVLDITGNELERAGIPIDKINNYYPRGFKDLDGFYKSIGSERKTRLQQRLRLEANKLGVDVKNLPDDLISNIVVNEMRGYTSNKLQLTKPSYSKQRQIEEITEDMLPYMDDAKDRLVNYIRKSTADIEKRKFFGTTYDPSYNIVQDIDNGIANLVSKERLENLSDKQLETLKDLLSKRFIEGTQSPNKIVRTLKDISYIGTLGNPFSAATQLGDLGQAANQTSVLNSVKALLKNKDITIDELGLNDIITAEINKDKSFSSKALNFILDKVQFKRADKLGKEVAVNAAFKEAVALSKNQKGLNQLETKWSNVFGKEYDSFVKDLQAGRITDNVRYYLWHKLSDIQPISLSEMPRHYLAMPNGRAFYALQTFTLKQLDIVRRTILDEWKNGSKKNAIKAAARYAIIVGGSNTAVDIAKDAALQRTINPYDIPKRFLFNLLKLFGVSEYMYDTKIKEGKLDEFFNYMWMPPIGVPLSPIADAVTITNKLLSDEGLTTEDLFRLQTIRRAPIFGKLLENYLGGGRERYNEEQLDRMYE